MKEELLDALQVAQLLGQKSPTYTFNKVQLDSSFPKPFKTGKRGSGTNKTLWSKKSVLAWKEADEKRKKDANGKRLPHSENQLIPMDSALASKFITGNFLSRPASIARMDKINTARTTGASIIKRERTQGVWG